MDVKKNDIRTLIVLGIVWVAYSVVVFALPFPMNAVFWLSYIFTTLAIAVQIYVLYSAFRKGDELRSKFYGFPIAKIGFIYLAVQLVSSLIFMLLSAKVPVWLPVILYVLFLAVAAVGFISAEAMKEEVERQDVQLKKDVSAMRGLQTNIRSLAAQNRDSAFSKELEELSEAFRYSDPVSSEATAELEAGLAAHLDTLASTVLEGDAESVAPLCKKVRAMLDERNRVCKLNK